MTEVRDMQGDVFIRIGEERDAETLVRFNIAMAQETENRNLLFHVVSEGVRNLLNSPQYGFYVVAERGDEICGSLMVTTEWSDWRNGLYWWIQSVYVKPEFRRQGVYRRLYEYVKARVLAEKNVCGLRLYVEQGNTVAQRVYQRLGMVESSYKIYEEFVP